MAHKNLKKLPSELLRLPLFIYLIPSWVIIALFNINRTELELTALWPVLYICWLIITFIFSIFTLILKNRQKASIASGFVVLTALTYGYVASIFNQSGLTFLGNDAVLLPLVFMSWFILGGFLINRKIIDISNFTFVLNLVGLVMVFYNMVSVLSYFDKNLTVTMPYSQESIDYTSSQKVRPDIYYMVLDTYPSNQTLSSQYNFEKNDLIEHLDELGFHVFENAHSNYQFTSHSLASTFNMRYLEHEEYHLSGKSNSLIPLYKMINRGSIFSEFKSLGYSIINISSRWGPTRNLELADHSYDEALSYELFGIKFTPSEFNSIILRNSLLGPLFDLELRLGSFGLITNSDTNGSSTSLMDLHAKTFERQVSDLKKSASEVNSPKFVLAHLLMPHVPYIYGPDGNRVEYSDDEPLEIKLINQIQYGNKRIKETVDSILQHDKNSVIIIQADEGPYPEGTIRNERFDWTTLNEEQLQHKFGILSAYYLPGIDLLDKPAPVNTFRILLNEYFGSELELLPDKQYVFKNQSDPYRFIDITDLISENY